MKGVSFLSCCQENVSFAPSNVDKFPVRNEIYLVMDNRFSHHLSVSESEAWSLREGDERCSHLLHQQSPEGLQGRVNICNSIR